MKNINEARMLVEEAKKKHDMECRVKAEQVCEDLFETEIRPRAEKGWSWSEWFSFPREICESARTSKYVMEILAEAGYSLEKRSDINLYRIRWN